MVVFFLKQRELSPNKGRLRGVFIYVLARVSTIVQKKRNIKTDNSLLTAKKTNKTINTLSKTSILLKNSTAKHR